MAEDKFIAIFEEIEERVVKYEMAYISELMRIFCERVNLSPVYVFFIKKENRLVDMKLSNPAFKEINHEFLRYVSKRRIPILIKISNFDFIEEEFYEHLSGVFDVMRELGLPNENVVQLALQAEKNLSTG